jgi:uridine kinase
VVIFVGGLSGSGKTVAASRSGVIPVLPLDSYFEDARPDLPKWLGRTDWETLDSYNLDGALSAILALLGGDCVAVPIYDHHRNARVGSRILSSEGAFVAEGVYAPETYKAVAAAGFPAVLLHIDAPARTAFCSRLRRDVGDRHMNPIWALIRSLRLAVRHRQYRRMVAALGADLLPRASAPQRIRQLATELG